MVKEPKGQSAKDDVDNTSNSLKNQLIHILENLLPVCKDQAWLKRQIKYVKNKKLEESYFYMSNVVTAFWYLLQKKQSELVNAENPNTKALRDFLKMCQENFEIIPDPNETIEETTTRILNEMKTENLRKLRSRH